MLEAGQSVPPGPYVPDYATRQLRAALILEEALETIRDLGFSVEPDDSKAQGYTIGSYDSGCDLSGVIDGCCDIKVVTTGTLSACGVPDRLAQYLVDRSNLRKFGPGSHRAPNGKWIKPKDWLPPDWAEFLRHISG